MIARRITKEVIPPIEEGQRLTQPEFHRRYEAMPPEVRAELIEGVVYMTSPLLRPHGRYQGLLVTVLCLYEAQTPGVEAADNATAILDDRSEPQPDAALRILPEYGGQCDTDEDDYWTGAPELVVEVADTTRRLDLGKKKRMYQEAGVLEYIVYSIKDKRLFWFDLRADEEVEPDEHGVFRSRVFPGLWIEERALAARNINRLVAVLQRGLNNSEHAAFVKQLKAARRRRAR